MIGRQVEAGRTASWRTRSSSASPPGRPMQLKTLCPLCTWRTRQPCRHTSPSPASSSDSIWLHVPLCQRVCHKVLLINRGGSPAGTPCATESCQVARFAAGSSGVKMFCRASSTRWQLPFRLACDTCTSLWAGVPVPAVRVRSAMRSYMAR